MYYNNWDGCLETNLHNLNTYQNCTIVVAYGTKNDLLVKVIYKDVGDTG